ncbi:hypothetical protein FA15DRAFT_667433 [Coprinopsis marcescibilis]|uniref:Matrin-type domain-containing protein n=1 Tax=Coprinopsis marcescibilis TaxID=230819 RepID=A0A5C3L1I1_COPMA|nr:hypothetical protein FA15DRAFT_667433 [Coprinopsis marcescibilis]
MSEYWVSKKKYYCKYCEIYIADDAPSRNHHENGMRHKGSLERYIRSVYKSGEKRKKDLEEEKRDMAQMERAANAAFAQDIGAGLARAPASVPTAGPSSSASGSRKPAQPSNPYANYTTAAQLGITDPDAERIAAEEELRRSQGIAGEWQVVSTSTSKKSRQRERAEGDEDVKPDVGASTSAGDKRPAEASPEDDDMQGFKVRKKRLNLGLGEIYDPGLIPIKVKKREEPKEEPRDEGASSRLASTSTISEERPKWTPLQLKRPGDVSTSTPAVKSEPLETPIAPTTTANDSTQAPSATAPKKWGKVAWGAPVEDVKQDFVFLQPVLTEEEAAAAALSGEVKQESSNDTVPSGVVTESAPKFKKRRAPANAARGRRDI